MPMVLLLLAACGSSGSGPAAWIDQPLNGTRYSLEPLTVTVHASDSDGIASFDFFVDGTRVGTMAAEGGRLADASWEWSPERAGEFSLTVIPVDMRGNRGEAAQTVVLIADLTQPGDTTLSQVPVQATVNAAIEKIECLPGQTVALTLNISSVAGIESFTVYNTVIQAEHSETFQAPLPTEIIETVQVTEPILDPVDRYHRWGLRVHVPGEVGPIFTYAVEPNDRCPGHHTLALDPNATPDLQLEQVQARQNATCRLGPDAAFEARGYLLAGESAKAGGKLTDGSWLQVELPPSNQLCWIAASLLDFDPGLISSLPAVAPPPTPAAAPSATPTLIQDTAAPTISGVSVNPALILTAGAGCPAYSRTTTVQATVTDDTGVGQVRAEWSIGGESGQVTLSSAGGSLFEGVIGPVNTTGVLSITVRAWDGASNTSSSSAPAVTVQNCIE